MARYLVASLLAVWFMRPAATWAACVGSGPNCAPCGTKVCVGDEWVCNPLPSTTPCNDGNLCTTGDHCDGIAPGTCVGSPVVCQSSCGDPNAPSCCKVPGTCNPSTGCSAETNKNNGTTCNDGNACTYTDVCTSGVCGGTPIDPPCSSRSTTCATYSCNEGSSTCSVSYAAASTTCSDSNACTGATGTADHCDGAGTCLSGTSTTCTASDQCHVAGTCNASSGSCSNPNAPNGTPCTSSDPHASVASCSNGSCSPTQCSSGYSLCTQCSAGLCNTSCIPGTQCCTNADCHLANGQGELTCNSSHQCVPPVICASGSFACGNDCIPQGACCTSEDCPSGFSCNSHACSLTCASGYQVCGATCIQSPPQACCPNDNI